MAICCKIFMYTNSLATRVLMRDMMIFIVSDVRLTHAVVVEWQGHRSCRYSMTYSVS